MLAREARRRAQYWIAANLEHWPDLIAAHFVGGVTAMEDDEPFPPTKDCDLHLIFDASSPMLQARGPFMNVLEESFDGLMLEAGVRSIAEYGSVEQVLGNPEVAHHLTLDSILYDPSGYLTALQIGVRAGYRDPRWVAARIDYERNAQQAALGLRGLANQMFGPLGELSILGYTTTFAKAVLDVATLRAPRIGGRLGVNLGDELGELGRPDLFEAALGVLGIRDLNPSQVDAWLIRTATLFDDAVAVRRTPHPFQHKMHAHLRPLCVDSCRRMFDEGFHREAMLWTIPYVEATTDILLVDGPDERKTEITATQAEFLDLLGFATLEQRDAKWSCAATLYDDYFTLATATALGDRSQLAAD